jgi:ribonuclease T1
LRTRVFKSVLTYLLCIAASGLSGVQAKELKVFSPDQTIALTSLPVQGQQTYQLILQGGPFAYEKDGTVFGNRERLLPNQKRGYYREYTVKTPGSKNRGARRIVCGGQVKLPDACFYTADHYASFRKIVH